MGRKFLKFFGLDKEIEVADDEFDEFRHLLSNSAAEFIYKRLEVLEKQIPGFQDQL
ncbi:12921_t:CDS:2 [Dentiscutata erythropus]|uniref:12921_t:CDS:1 n=1 Tax=Dentiscutata erythropus TaxID=1348616 RepID=A0A9N9C7H7_9GLOM|nr:12921_t:CDS:2 [Dentiscutata erythropus]